MQNSLPPLGGEQFCAQNLIQTSVVDAICSSGDVEFLFEFDSEQWNSPNVSCVTTGDGGDYLSALVSSEKQDNVKFWKGTVSQENRTKFTEVNGYYVTSNDASILSKIKAIYIKQ